MQLSFRWYGPSDRVSLNQIRQIPGMQGVVTSLYDTPVGEVWQEDDIASLKGQIESAGLSISVIESVPVHEDIKMGLPTRDRYIEHYIETLRRLAAAKIETVCYNFMPLFDWLRTSLAYELSDGSNTLAYLDDEVDEDALLSGKLRLPAWDMDSDRDRLSDMLSFYRGLSTDELWNNLTYFVKAVMPIAKEVGIRMAIHPDDPPWPVLGIPRIMVSESAFHRLLDLYDDAANGVCFCAGSLGSSEENDLEATLKSLLDRGRVNFVHLRNVKRMGPRSFYESGHLSKDGSVDMYRLMRLLANGGYRGPLRPDHGRMIWDETGNAGYGLYDRALGAAYLNGLWEAVSQS